MIVPIPRVGITKLMRFVLVELPTRRLELRQDRIDFAIHNDVLPQQREEVVELLAAGVSLRRALRRCRREERRRGGSRPVLIERPALRDPESSPCLLPPRRAP